MRHFQLLLALSLCSAACYAATVSIAQPSSSTTTSPVAVSASVTGSSSVLELYVDGKKVTQVHAATLSTSVAMTDGSHRIAIQSVDANHVITKAVKYITVSTPGTTYSNLQESSSWQTCGNCGNTGASGTTAPYTMTRGITSPAMDNTSTSSEFWIGGSTPYTNGYWFLRDEPATAPVKKLVYDFYLYIPTQYASAPQAIEFECQQTINGYTYNYAWQADYPSHTWRTFDYVAKKWVSTTIAFNGLTGGTWHHLIAEYHADGTNTVHDALTVDGIRYPVGIVHAAKATTQTWTSLTNAFQLDLNKYATDFSVYVDKMQVTFQQ